MEYFNTTLTNFSAAVANSGLVSGINHQLLEMVLAMLGIIQQFTKKTYHKYQKKIFFSICENMLIKLFD